MGSHSNVHAGVGLVSSNDCLIKSMEHIRPINLCCSEADINGQDVSPSPIRAPLSHPVHPFYPNLIHGSTAPAVPSYHSYLYLTHVDCNDVHGGEVSPSRDAESESLMPDLCHSHSLTGEEESLASHLAQVGSLINLSSLPIQEEPYVSDTQLDQSGGFSDSHFVRYIFTHASGDYPTKPLEFADPPFESLGTHLEVEALQLSMMVMLGSHIPDETPKPSRIRISTHHAPQNIFSLDASSSWKPSNSSNVPLRKSFHHISNDVHQPLYPNLFAEGSVMAIVSILFHCLPSQ